MSHSTSWRFILILSSQICLHLKSGLLPFGFPTKTLNAPLLSLLHATRLVHLILLNFITSIMLRRGQVVKSLLIWRFPNRNEYLRRYRINVWIIRWYFKIRRRREDHLAPKHLYVSTRWHTQEALHFNKGRDPVHSIKAYKGSRGMAPLILNFVTR